MRIKRVAAVRGSLAASLFGSPSVHGRLLRLDIDTPTLTVGILDAPNSRDGRGVVRLDMQSVGKGDLGPAVLPQYHVDAAHLQVSPRIVRMGQESILIERQSPPEFPQDDRFLRLVVQVTDMGVPLGVRVGQRQVVRRSRRGGKRQRDDQE